MKLAPIKTTVDEDRVELLEANFNAVINSMRKAGLGASKLLK